MKNDTEEKQWFVLEAAYNGALKAQRLFTDLEIESFVPMHLRETKTKGQKIVKKLTPVFYNLIFVDTTYSRLREIRSCHSYLWCKQNKVGEHCEPMTVPREQMRAFIDFVSGNFEEIEYIDDGSFDIRSGERVRIKEGVFAGKAATLVKVTGRHRKQIVVAIDGLLAVTINHKNPSRIIERV